MSNWKGYIVSITFIIGISFLLKAEVAFFHYGIDKGLPEARITSISQDSAGFIWLAGANTLFRFDGDRFINYQNIMNSPTESFFGDIKTMYTDSKGILWVGSSNGLSWYDFPGNVFMRPGSGWKEEDVHDIAEDANGYLWMATDEGLVKLDPESMHSVWYTDTMHVKTAGNNVLPVRNIYQLTCQPDGKIWFSDSSGTVFLFDPVTLKTKTFNSLAKTSLRFQNITNLRYHNNLLFISTLSQGFYWYDALNNEVGNEEFSSYGKNIHHFSINNDSIIWLASNNGLLRFNSRTREFRRYTEEPGNPLSLSRTALSYVYTDRENNLWISTGLRGIDYGLVNTPFRHLLTAGEGPYQLRQPEVTAIEFDQENNMWLGYEEGYIEKHTHTPLTRTLYTPEATNNAGRPGTIFKIFSDSKNRIWFGGWNSGLQKLNTSTSSFELAPILPDSLFNVLSNADIRGIAEDNSGNLWVSYHGIGLGKYEPETNRMELFRHKPHDLEGSLSNNWTFNICTDKENNLWIATAHGVSKMNLTNGTFENYFHDDNNIKSLNQNSINTINCDPGGNIWAGTDNGLNVYIPSLNTFIPVLNNADNASYNISGIQSVKPGEIWASTKSGIISISWSWDSMQEGILSNIHFFNRRSGLLSTSYFAGSSAATNDGLIFFGGNEGIDFFNAEQASNYQLPSPVPVLTELIIDGVSIWFDYEKEKPLNLNRQHRMISIRFAAPSYTNPEKQKFRYQLEGFDEQWNYPQYEQVATYTNLPAGQYTFKVETEDRNGNWGTNTATLSIIVEPPFWNTLTFYILTVIVAALIVLIIIYARSRIFLLRQKELEKIIDTRTRELLYNNAELEKINQTKDKLFSIISHDLRSPFAGVLGILELLTDEESGMDEERKQELLVLAKNSAVNTFELLENLLTWAHSQMKQTQSKPVKQNLSSILIKNIELKKTSAQQKEIEILRNFPEELNASFDRDMINTVVRNLLNNAVKFTHPGGKIEVFAENENGEVKVSIADTGIGIDNEDTETIFYDGNLSKKGTLGEKGTGLGLVICREFVEKNAGKIWATHNQPKGTVFHFTLPTG